MPPSRRVFLKTTTATAVSLCAGCASAPKTAAAPQDGSVRLALAEHPGLGEAGGALSVDVDGLDEPVLIFNRGEAGYAAVSQKCPHLGCKVSYEGEEDALRCPCHGSRFSTGGEKIKGPAKTGLSAYPIALEGDELVLSVG